MKLSAELKGVETLAARLRAKIAPPLVARALDDAAGAARDAAADRLRSGGEPAIAASLRVDAPTKTRRIVTSDHPRARFAEFGTRRRPALFWTVEGLRTAREKLTVSILAVFRRGSGSSREGRR